MIELVGRLFDSWNEQGIRYCHWKSTDHLDATMQGITDIDVLVDRGDAMRAEELALKAGYIRMHTVPLRTYPGVLDFIGFDDRADRWVHIHLHYQLVLGDRWVKATWLPLERLVLDRRIYDEKYRSYVLDAEDEMYIFCARMALKHRHPFSLDSVIREYKYLRGRVSNTGSRPAGYPEGLEELDKLVSYARTESASTRILNRRAQKTARSLAVFRRYGRARFMLLSLLRRSYRYYVEFRRRILKNYAIGRREISTGGKIVVFVGIDGSGKSSAVKRTERFVAQQVNVTRVFLGNGRSGANWYRRLIFFIFGARAKWKRHKEIRSTDSSSRNTRIPWYYSIWMLLAIRDKEKNLKRAIAARANGALVLSDRWPQSQLDSTLDGPRLAGREGLTGLAKYVAKRESEFIKLAAMVRPDMVLRLQVTASEACRRKPGEFETAEAQRNGELLNQIRWEAKSVEDIDANQSIDTVDGQIRSAVWKVLRGES